MIRAALAGVRIVVAVVEAVRQRSDLAELRRRARETIMTERYEQRSKEYLREIRRGAMLEYK